MVKALIAKNYEDALKACQVYISTYDISNINNEEFEN